MFKLFCRHKDSFEVSRFYKTDYGSLYLTRYGDIGRNYYVSVYKIYRCKNCNKLFSKLVLDKQYKTKESMDADIEHLKSLDYASYEDYVLK